MKRALWPSGLALAVALSILGGFVVAECTACTPAERATAANDVAKAIPYAKVACAVATTETRSEVVAEVCGFVEDELPILEEVLRGKALAATADAGP